MQIILKCAKPITVSNTELEYNAEKVELKHTEAQCFTADLLYGVWYTRVDEPEEQVPEGPTLSAQHCGPRSPCVGQRQVDGQQFHTQQHKLVMFPGEGTESATVRS